MYSMYLTEFLKYIFLPKVIHQQRFNMAPTGCAFVWSKNPESSYRERARVQFYGTLSIRSILVRLETGFRSFGPRPVKQTFSNSIICNGVNTRRLVCTHQTIY